jgi:hypothetical protein
VKQLIKYSAEHVLLVSPLLPQQDADMKNNKKKNVAKVQPKIIPLKNKFVLTIYALEVT